LIADPPSISQSKPLIKKYFINMIEVLNFDFRNSIKFSICVSVDTAKQIFLGTK